MLVALLELVKAALLLIKILNKAASTLLHLSETAFQTEPIGSIGILLLTLHGVLSTVLGVPNIVSNEFLEGDSPLVSQVLLCDVTDGCHQSLNILNQDIVTSDKDLFLRSLRSATLLSCLIG